mgnify:CR=1 FL=1
MDVIEIRIILLMSIIASNPKVYRYSSHLFSSVSECVLEELRLSSGPGRICLLDIAITWEFIDN